MLASNISFPSIPMSMECAAYYVFGQSSEESNGVIERLKEIRAQKREEIIRRRKNQEHSDIEEFDEAIETNSDAGVDAERLHSRGWSRMIEETVKSQGWSRSIMELARLNQVSCEIEEVMMEDIREESRQVYVAVGKNPSVLQWALNHVVKEGESVTLIHVFPPFRSIPTPVGKLPRNQVAQDMVESYIKEEKEKRSKLLQNYLDMCSNAKMKAETVLIESDMAHKSLVELITDLQITKLVIGTKPAIHPMTRKLKKMGPGKAEYVQRHAPHFCEVFVICEGKIIFPKVRDFKYSDASSTTLSRHVADDQRGEDAINCMGFYRRILR